MSLIARLRKTINPNNHTTGSKIRRIRVAKEISAKEIGQACGVNDMAIRNYETGQRHPNDQKLEDIAKCLGVDVAALYDRKISSYVDVMHILFELEDDYRISLCRIADYPYFCIVSQNKTLNEALGIWLAKREMWENQAITDAEYDDWKNSFPAQCAKVGKEKL